MREDNLPLGEDHQYDRYARARRKAGKPRKKQQRKFRGFEFIHEVPHRNQKASV